MSTRFKQKLLLPLSDMYQQLTRRWATLSRTGRRTITICAALLVAGLSWALVYEPIQSSLSKNRLRIQELRVQAAQMREQATAVQSIRTMAPVATIATQAVADVAGLQALFGPKTVVTIALTPMTGSAAGVATFKVALEQVPYSVLVDRLEQATGRYRVRVLSMALARAIPTPPSSTTSTLVSGELLLVDSK
jgi:type II secretory pathway component PulM